MAYDVLLSGHDESRAAGDRAGIVAFVPIAVALIGIGAILLGGISARGDGMESVASAGVDPVTTGSVAPADSARRAMELLDR